MLTKKSTIWYLYIYMIHKLNEYTQWINTSPHEKTEAQPLNESIEASESSLETGCFGLKKTRWVSKQLAMLLSCCFLGGGIPLKILQTFICHWNPGRGGTTQLITRWWVSQIFVMFTPIWEDEPILTHFFRWVETNNQLFCFAMMISWGKSNLSKEYCVEDVVHVQ